MARSRAGTTRSPRRGRELVARGTLLLALAGVASCTAREPAPAPPERERVALRVTTVGPAGLTAARRAELEDAVGDVLSHYVVEGFLGDYPREAFIDSFDDFTSGATELAARDIGVLTAARVGDATDVQPRRLDARLSFLVHDGDVLGATAALDFALLATMRDGDRQRVRLWGRLVLMEQRGRWSVFAFDVANDDGAPLGEGGS